MQENEFEQNMQRQLEGLRMEPSGSLWQRIAVQVAQKNNRRRGWFFLLMLCIGLFGIIGYVMLPSSPKAETASRKKDIEVKSASNLKPSSLTVVPGHSLQLGEGTLTTQQDSLKAVSQKLSDPLNTTVIAASKKGYHKKQVNIQQGKRLAIQLNSPELAEDSNDVLAKSGDQQKNNLKNSGVFSTSIVAGEMAESINDAKERSKEEVLRQLEKQNPSLDFATSSKALAAGIKKETLKIEAKKERDSINPGKQGLPKQSTGNKKWVASIFISAGKSFVASENSKALIEDYQGSVGNGTSSGISNSPPPITKGLWSFAAGIQVERKLFDRLSITSGIQYRLFTTSNAIGEPATSPVTNMPNREVDSFKSGNSRQYVSYFHQLSIPLLVTVQLSNPASREIKLSAGVNFSTLLAAKALQYNATTNRYFESNSLLNNNSIGLSGLLLINLSGKGKAPVYIGPEWYYSLASIRNAGLFAGYRQNFLGVRLQYALGKK